MTSPDPDSLIEAVEDPAVKKTPARGWSSAGRPPTTLVLVRHGVTPHTMDKRFSGGLASANPGLSDLGRAQMQRTAEWLSSVELDAVVASPVLRTVESAAIIGEFLNHDVAVESGFAEMEFGAWDGLTFVEVAEKYKDELDAWLGSIDVAPGGGESMREVETRVHGGLERVLAEYAGQTVAVVSHVTPIKTLVAHAMGAPLESLFRMELTPASVSVVSFYEGGGRDGDERVGSLRLFNACPGDEVLSPARF